ncbi:uncharacterized protein Tco025E_00577 [Trypanosoma conorhini]|uniref:Uncharacterized protein n=1 Tax=Trypanosoma conorhini TaxID=83891 RepID=A0A3R7PYH9_9TRYP|nr:uncharacterized protein Tco025E_00577 [Trypanosoma conorhini]RNF27203.1 hypothetical protein Tco025E_00577 [Trypanosoma conorhini]
MACASFPRGSRCPRDLCPLLSCSLRLLWASNPCPLRGTDTRVPHCHLQRILANDSIGPTEKRLCFRGQLYSARKGKHPDTRLPPRNSQAEHRRSCPATLAVKRNFTTSILEAADASSRDSAATPPVVAASATLSRAHCRLEMRATRPFPAGEKRSANLCVKPPSISRAGAPALTTDSGEAGSLKEPHRAVLQGKQKWILVPRCRQSNTAHKLWPAPQTFEAGSFPGKPTLSIHAPLFSKGTQQKLHGTHENEANPTAQQGADAPEASWRPRVCTDPRKQPLRAGNKRPNRTSKHTVQPHHRSL